MSTKLILPTSLRFDLAVILYHNKGGKIKVNFTRQENNMIDTGWEGPFKPESVNYRAAVNEITFSQLQGQGAKDFAASLHYLAIEVVSTLIQYQTKVEAYLDTFAWMAAYLIDWALDDNEIPEGTHGKVLLHCSAELQDNKRYLVKVDATSPAYNK